MIIIQLKGGLGNQLFQYALGRHLAHSHHCDLKLDLSVLLQKNDAPLLTRRNYELAAFDIQATRLDNESQNLFHSFRRRFFSPKIRFIQEKNFAFDASIFILKPPLHLAGYWQSEQYFKSIASILREELKPRVPFSENGQLLRTQITRCQSVGIHIRRGDYIANPISYQLHGVCSLDYYQQAIKWIAAKLDDPFFFIFSDEPAWVKKNLAIPYPHFLVESPADQAAFEDMILMSYCKHQIIANSSYSWWAAWLNENPNKWVIAPNQWFQNKNIYTGDLLPDSWIKL